MKKASLVFLAAAVLSYSAAARAQNSTQTQEPAGTPVTQASTLEDRYTQCIKEALCPLQTRLQIAQEENNEMNVHFQKIYEACAASNFQGCVDNQQGEMDMWHSTEYRMEQMMLSIEAQSLALKESAAGGPDKPADQPQKSLWDRIWGK